MIERLVRGGIVSVLPAIKGLVSDGHMVKDVINASNFDCVGLSVSEEEIEGLRNYDALESPEISPLEAAYGKLLQNFGEVMLPPPCFQRAVLICDDIDINLFPLDMDDESYTEAFCENVNVRDMFRESIITRRILKTKFDVSDKESFVLDWDRRVNGPSGFRRLESAREKHIATRIKEMAELYERPLAIVELERVEGVIDRLDAD